MHYTSPHLKCFGGGGIKSSLNNSNTLTFDLQEDMIFKNPKDIPGNTSVFPAVSWSRYPYFQGAVVMQGVRVSIQSAGPAIFEPEAQRGHVKKKKVENTLSSVRSSCTHQVMFGMGDPKNEQSNIARWFRMTSYFLLTGVRTLGGSATMKQWGFIFSLLPPTNTHTHTN